MRLLTMDEARNDDIIIEGKHDISFSSSSFSFFFLHFEGRSAVSFAKEVDLFTRVSYITMLMKNEANA